MRRVSIALVLLSLSALPVKAWNSLGHQAVAEIAWRQLDAGQRRAAADLLKQHPHYRSVLVAGVPAGVDTNEWAFLTAAIWPDLIRPAKPGQPIKPHAAPEYNLYPHGIDLPFARPGDSGCLPPETLSPGEPDARVALSNSLARLKDPKVPAQERAVSLCWVLHLCADLHQPLHTAALVTKDKPKGYGSGGACLALDPQGQQVGLHTFWDQLPGADLSYKGVAALADDLSAARELKPAALKEYQAHSTVASWVQESHRAAVDFAYAADRVQFVEAAAVKSGRIAASAIPALKPEYISEARQIARRRLALAAQRLADQLKQAW